MQQIIDIPVNASKVVIDSVEGLAISLKAGATTREFTEPIIAPAVRFELSEPPINQGPTVLAGVDQTIKLPVTSVTLRATGTDPENGVLNYIWERVMGSGVIQAPNAAVTAITGLTEGTSVFKVTTIDDKGASDSDDVAIIVQAADVVPPTDPSYALVYSNTLDTVAQLDPEDRGQYGAGTLASHLSTTIFKTGPGAFKSVTANVSNGIRSEIQLNSSVANPDEGAIEYDVRYETIFQNSGHSLQFHPNTSGGSASPGLWHENGKFVWVNWKGGTNTKYPTNFTIPQNKWMHVVFEYKFGSAGYMRFTIDGVVVLNKTGIQVGDNSGHYFKLGVNMWAQQNSVVYYDNLKIWKKI